MPERLFVFESFVLSCGSEIEGADLLLLLLTLQLVS